MKKILLLTVAMLSATTAYSACTPPIGKCDCAFPKFENGALTCGESYCKEKTCMPNGSCCTTPNKTKTECCDNYNNGVAKDGSCCPSLLPSDCETEVDETTGCNVCKSACPEETPVPCGSGDNSWCCAEGNSCGESKGECCIGSKCCSDGLKPYRYGNTVGCCSQEPVSYYYEAMDETYWVCCDKNEEIYSYSSIWMSGLPEDGYFFYPECCVQNPRETLDSNNGGYMLCCKNGTHYETYTPEGAPAGRLYGRCVKD